MSRKSLYFDNCCGYSVFAAVENGKLARFDFEREDGGNIIGNIYKGRVENVLPGLRAAFVNCGLGKNCFLAFDEDRPDCEIYGGRNAFCATDEIKEGDEIAVQVVKAPVGNKGAKVTLNLSFAGKFLIYLPRADFTGVSQKISDAELRRNLVFFADNLKQKHEGLIVRTAAPYAKGNEIKTEYLFLKNLYGKVESAFGSAATGTVLHSDFSLAARILRDLPLTDVEDVTAGSQKLWSLLENAVEMCGGGRRIPVKLHDTGKDMFSELGISAQIKELLSKRAELDNGGYLVIEKTEALTSIDVNTGKFTGEDSAEQSVYYTNVLAAREIARQVKLRNIGGITVVDFIDMKNPAHRKAVVEELERALRSCSEKCAVSAMSQFGLVEFTRKRTGGNPLSPLIKPCGHCGGAKFSVSATAAVFALRAGILEVLTDGCDGMRVDLNAGVLDELKKSENVLSDLKSRCRGADVRFVPHRSYGEEQMNFRTANYTLPPNAEKLF